MNPLKVSILIPVYKAADFIEKCAESVFSQTFESIEYIFVDDCSPDDSIEKLENTLKRFPNRTGSVTILRNHKNMGISYSRQRAFDKATAEYFLAMDSDDWIEPDMIELLYKKAVEKDADIVYCHYFADKADGRQTVIEPSFSNNKKSLIYDTFIGYSAYWNKLIRREILTEHKIKTLEGVNFADDLIVLVKLIYHSNRFAEVEKPLYHYVQYNVNSCTKNIGSPKHIADRLAVMSEVERFLESKPDYDNYKDIMFDFKALRKIKIIRTTYGNKEYLQLFPEIAGQINSSNLPLKSKIILRLSAKNHAFRLKLFLKLLELAGKITGKEFY